ncbi:VOC family protein [Williamsia sterculiae]|nr:VOC family protein [Williamsia sterculiae]
MATPSFSPYISFPGNAHEAFDHYADLFGGTLDLRTYGSIGDTSGFPFEPPADAVAHAQLTGGLVTLAGGDAIGDDVGGGASALASDHYSFIIGPDSVGSARDLIDRVVSAGGEKVMPFEVAPWGDHYGQVRDRFGVVWQIVVPGDDQPG